MNGPLNRRELLRATAALSLALTTFEEGAEAIAAPPPYTISINIEIMFPRTMSRPDRIAPSPPPGSRHTASGAPRRRSGPHGQSAAGHRTEMRRPRRHRQRGRHPVSPAGAQDALLAEIAIGSPSRRNWARPT